MSVKSLALAACTALAFATPVFADSTVMVKDAYARVASKAAKAGAAFLELHNMGTEADRLIEVRSDVSARTELHTHKDMGDGVMKMMHVEEGFIVPAGGSHMLARGGDHVMFMGLKQPLAHGDTVEVIFVFEKAGEISVEIPVDNERAADHGAMQHGKDTHAHH